ncbi:MAG TPA: YncE family protein [Mycobacteriales bacterium]|nr:YncE family protein [Mycobacteriales bacterium]
MVFITSLSVISACGSAPRDRADRLPAAAEPSRAPALSARPAGRVVPLPPGSEPEGVAVDPDTHTAVVALRRPDRIALVNTRSLAVTVRSAPGEARHLILVKPGGPVLLPAENDATAYELALPSGRVLRSTPVQRQPHNAAVVGPDIWVADELAPAISVINSAGNVIATLHGPVQPGGVVTAAGTVGVTDVRGARMYFYDATTFAAEGSITLGTGPTHAVGAGGDVAVAADTRGGQLLLVDMATRRVVSRLAMPGGPYGLASDPASGNVWVTLTQRNQVVQVATTPTGMRVVATTPTVQQPNTVAVDTTSGCVYVAGVTAARLDVTCPKDPKRP